MFEEVHEIPQCDSGLSLRAQGFGFSLDIQPAGQVLENMGKEMSVPFQFLLFFSHTLLVLACSAALFWQLNAIKSSY